jgi:hypothetical protein
MLETMQWQQQPQWKERSSTVSNWWLAIVTEICHHVMVHTLLQHCIGPNGNSRVQGPQPCGSAAAALVKAAHAPTYTTTSHQTATFLTQLNRWQEKYMPTVAAHLPCICPLNQATLTNTPHL